MVLGWDGWMDGWMGVPRGAEVQDRIGEACILHGEQTHIRLAWKWWRTC